MTVFLHHFDDIGLLAEHKLVHHLVDGGGFAVAAVQLVVDDRVVDAVQAEVHQTGQHRLAAFAEQKLLEAVVAEWRELDVDLTDDADQLFLLRFIQLQLAEYGQNEPEQVLYLAVAHHALAGEALDDRVHADVDRLVGRAGHDLVRTALVGDHHNQITDQKRVRHLHEHGLGQLEAGVALQTGKVQRNDRNEAVAVLFQRLAEQVDIVGRTAAAAGLRQDERDFVNVVFTGLDGIHQLADDQQGGVAGVVVHVAQTLLRDVRTLGVQQLHVVAVVFHQAADESKLHGQHVRYQNLIGFSHFLRELRVGICGRCLRRFAVLQACVPPLRRPACCGYGFLPHRGC